MTAELKVLLPFDYFQERLVVLTVCSSSPLMFFALRLLSHCPYLPKLFLFYVHLSLRSGVDQLNLKSIEMNITKLRQKLP